MYKDTLKHQPAAVTKLNPYNADILWYKPWTPKGS